MMLIDLCAETIKVVFEGDKIGLLWWKECISLSRNPVVSRVVGRGRSRVFCWGGEGGRAYSFVACLSFLTVDHSSPSRRGTVPTPTKGTSSSWALIIVIFPYIS